MESSVAVGGGRRWLRVLGALGLLLVLWPLATSCAHLRELVGLGPRRPEVKLVGIEVEAATLAAVRLQVALEVMNPNDFALDFSRLRYELGAVDRKVAHGSYQNRIVIPAGARQVIRLPVEVDPGGAAALAAAFLKTRAPLEVLIRATADFQTPVGAMEVSFEDRKTVARWPGT